MTTDESYSQFTAPGTPATPAEARPSVGSAAASLCRSNRQLLSELRSQLSALREQHARFDRILLGTPGSFSGPDAASRTWPQFGLTEREIEVARLLAEGRRNTAIAAALGISPHTARHHTQRVLAKVGVHSRAEAAAKLRA